MTSCTSRSDANLFVVLALNIFVGLVLLCLFFRLLYLVRDDPLELDSATTKVALAITGIFPVEVFTRTAAVWQHSKCNLATHELLLGVGGVLIGCAVIALYSLERMILRYAFSGTKYDVPKRTIRVLDIGFGTALFFWFLCAFTEALYKDEGFKKRVATFAMNTMAFLAITSVFCKIIYEFSGRLIELVAAQRKFREERQLAKLKARNQEVVQPKADDGTAEINMATMTRERTRATSASAGALSQETVTSSDWDCDDVIEVTNDDDSDLSSDATDACGESDCTGDDGGVKSVGDDCLDKGNCADTEQKSNDATARIRSLTLLSAIEEHSAELTRFGAVHREFLIVAAKQMLLSMWTTIAIICGFIGLIVWVFSNPNSLFAVIGSLLYDLDWLIIATRVCLNHRLFAAEYKLMCGSCDLFCRRLASYRTHAPEPMRCAVGSVPI